MVVKDVPYDMKFTDPMRGMIDNYRDPYIQSRRYRGIASETRKTESANANTKIKQIIYGVYFWVHTTVVLIIPRIGGTKKIEEKERGTTVLCTIPQQQRPPTVEQPQAQP